MMDQTTVQKLTPVVVQVAARLAERALDLREGGEVFSPSSVSKEWNRRTVNECAAVAWQIAQSVVDLAPGNHNK
jgi:hypothetical protein